MNIGLGLFLNRISYKYIPFIGSIYKSYQNVIESYEQSSNPKDWIYQRVLAMVSYAYDNIPFYKDFYDTRSFHPSDLTSFDDIRNIPIVSKEDLIKVDLKMRSKKSTFSYVATTGGSSGNPLAFYKDRTLQIKEMAFYHNEWAKLGYSKDKLRLQFVGRTDKAGVTYDLARNQLRVSIYEPYSKVLSALKQINSQYKVEYIQGYPSVLYDFAAYCENHADEFASSKLKDSLRGVFLNSEYPQPQYIHGLANIFNIETIASYGHTEGAGLAFDRGEGNYVVQQAYGFVEVEKIDDEYHLITTSYDNWTSPFIRYDTGDVVSGFELQSDILGEFRLDHGGRISDFIISKDGRRISLTGVIFGKHHRLFEYCKQIQIYQPVDGYAVVLFVTKDELSDNFCPAEYFDSSGIDVEFSFQQISEPIRTKSGKVLLKVDTLSRDNSN